MSPASPATSSMTSPGLDVAHFFSGFRTLGGVQAVLRQHHERDSEWGLTSRFVITQEAAPAEPLPRVHFLPLSRWATIHGLTKALRFLRQVPQPLVNIYHTIIPMRAYLCEHDCAARRLLVIHGTGGDLAGAARAAADMAGRRDQCKRGGAADCPAGPAPYACRTVRSRACPDHPLSGADPACADGRAAHRPGLQRPLPQGAQARGSSARTVRKPAAPWGGLSVRAVGGRSGAGLARTAVARQRTRVRFLGRKQGAEYLRQLATWDFVVLVSDTEGQPVSLMEAMSGGALPLFPRVGSAGDAYTEAVHPRLLYPPGDIPEAASRVVELSRQPESEIEQLRARSISAVRPNVDGTYFARVAEFARAVVQWPRISTDQFPWHPAAFDRLPISVASWIALQRRRWLLAGAKRAS